MTSHAHAEVDRLPTIGALFDPHTEARQPTFQIRLAIARGFV